MKQIDDNTLKIRTILDKNESYERRVEEIKSELVVTKNSLAQILNSTASEIDQPADIANLVQNQEEELSKAIQLNRDIIADKQREINDLEAQLKKDEDQLVKVLAASRLSLKVGLSMVNIVIGLVLVAIFNWEAQGDWIFLQFIAFLGLGNLLLGTLVLQFGGSSEDWENVGRESGEAKQLIANIAMGKTRIKSNEKSINSLQKNNFEYSSKRQTIGKESQESHEMIIGLRKNLVEVQKKISTSTLNVLELEKENAEVWTSISDLIPSEFH